MSKKATTILHTGFLAAMTILLSLGTYVLKGMADGVEDSKEHIKEAEAQVHEPRISRLEDIAQSANTLAQLQMQQLNAIAKSMNLDPVATPAPLPPTPSQ